MRLITAIFVVVLGVAAQAGELIRFTRATVNPKDVQINLSEKSNEWIVQFTQSVTENHKKQLQRFGLKILGYLPDDAVVVQGDVLKIQYLPGLNGIIPYAPEFKISTEITSLTTGRGNEAWVVTAFNKGAFQRVLKKLSYKILAEDGRAAVILAPRKDLLRIASLAGVEHIQPYTEFKLQYMDSLASVENMDISNLAPLDGTESGTKAMGFESVWSQGLTGKGQIAAFADTGLDSGDMNSIHSDFKNGVKAGQALGLFAKSWEDPFGHGTHVAGSIAGRGVGQALVKGGAYEAMLVAQSMWSPMMDNIMPPTKLDTLFNKAQSEGAKIHSDSWGKPTGLGAYDSFAQQADEWIFNNPDVLVIFAAGNNGEDNNKDGRIDGNSIGSPATAKNVLTVGASENATTSGGIQVPINKLRDPSKWSTEPIFSSKISDNINGLAMFSSRGPTSDGRIKPDVVAPGTNILSTRSRQPKSNDLWGRYGDDYVWSGGTSMSTPLVAGAAAVARQYLVEKKNQNPSSAMLKAFIQHMAVDMYPGQYGEVGERRGQEILTKRPNNDEGFGRVEMSRLSEFANSTSGLVDEKNGIQANEEKTYPIVLSKSGKLLVNLVYNDAPASPNAAATLINDLDMTLVKPDGSQVSASDKVNNFEVIEMNLPVGDYKLIIKGTKVPQGKQGKQPFAVVWSQN